MNNFLVLQVFQCDCDLVDIVFGLNLCESFPAFEEFAESLYKGKVTWFGQI